MKTKKPAIELGLESCLRAAIEFAEECYRFQPSSYSYATLAALHNAARFLPPIINDEEASK
jgi:hypothetical protein